MREVSETPILAIEEVNGKTIADLQTKPIKMARK